MVEPSPSPADVGSGEFATALDAAITRRRMTLDVLAQRLRDAGTPASIATLSYWRSGRTLPTRERSLAAIDELERILKLPVAALRSKLPHDLASRWDPLAAVPYSERALYVLRSLGMDADRGFHNVMVHDSCRVPREPGIQYEHTRQLLEAEVDGLDKVALVMMPEGDEDEPTPLITAGLGCTLGRVVQLDEHGLLVAELLLDRPLAKGELHRLDYRMRVELPTSSQGSALLRVLPTPMSVLVLDVLFETDVVPVVRYKTAPHRNSADPQDAEVHEQQQPGSRFVQVTLAEPVPGLHGLVWDREPQGAGSR